MYDYSMEHICSYSARLANPLEVIGPVAEGIRLNAYVTGGEVNGPRLTGKVRPVGADWLTIRTDGIAILDVRVTLETHDGALIYLSYTGIGDLGEDGHAKFLNGEPIGIVSLRTTPRMQCSHPDYTWVNRLQFVNIGEVDFERLVVSYDVYALG